MEKKPHGMRLQAFSRVLHRGRFVSNKILNFIAARNLIALGKGPKEDVINFLTPQGNRSEVPGEWNPDSLRLPHHLLSPHAELP